MVRESGVRAARVDVAGCPVHLVETGSGPPVLHLHGTNTCALSHFPLLEAAGVHRSIAVDRPGFGLSERRDIPHGEFREYAVRFVDELLDALDLARPVLAGGSMGGLWALWYALAHPDRVRRLVLLGATPLLPGTRAPIPLRLMATPGLGRVLGAVKPSRALIVRMMDSVGEADTIMHHPLLLDSLVAGARDPQIAAANRAELRAVLTSVGFKRSMRVTAAELAALSVPTLLVWGDRDPVCSVDAARAVADVIPEARLEVLPAGHVPWLGHPHRVAELVAEFVGTPSP
jgi:pimeloyl-ACP methyl ester carboxylesterase